MTILTKSINDEIKAKQTHISIANIVHLEPENTTDIQLCIGQEFYIHKMVALNAAISSKPLMVSLGISFTLPMCGVYTGFVHHPILGWSQGVGMEYVKRKKME